MSQESTFQSFTPSQSASYALNRRDYHQSLYDAVLAYHKSSPPSPSPSSTPPTTTILDVGTGPGTAVRALAPYFTSAIGIDPSPSMIATARSLGGVTSTSSPIRFEVSSAEHLGTDLTPPAEPGTVDLITAATAAHWFDMPLFWARAAQVLKPGGTVALWTSGRMVVDKDMPGAEGVQAAFRRLGERLEGYMTAGNRLSHGLYRELEMPWTVGEPGVEGFERGGMVRREWGTGREGAERGDMFYRSQPAVDLETLEMVLGTTSPVVRWRGENQGLVGTEEDLVRVMRREIEGVLRGAGVEEGAEMIRGGVEGVLVMVKKKA